MLERPTGIVLFFPHPHQALSCRGLCDAAETNVACSWESRGRGSEISLDQRLRRYSVKFGYLQRLLLYLQQRPLSSQFCKGTPLLPLKSRRYSRNVSWERQVCDQRLWDDCSGTRQLFHLHRLCLQVPLCELFCRKYKTLTR